MSNLTFGKIGNKPILLFDEKWEVNDPRRKSFFLELGVKLHEVVVPFIESQLQIIISAPAFPPTQDGSRLLIQFGIFERKRIPASTELTPIRLSDLTTTKDKNEFVNILNNFCNIPIARAWKELESELAEENFVKFYFIPESEEANAEENVVTPEKGPYLRTLIDFGKLKNSEAVQKNAELIAKITTNLLSGLIEWLNSVETEEVKRNKENVVEFINKRIERFSNRSLNLENKPELKFEVSQTKKQIDLSNVPLRKVADFSIGANKVELELTSIIYNDKENSFKIFAAVKHSQTLANEKKGKLLNFNEIFGTLTIDNKRWLEEEFATILSLLICEGEKIELPQGLIITPVRVKEENTKKDTIIYFSDQLMYEIYAPSLKVIGMNNEIALKAAQSVFEAFFRWICLVNFVKRTKE